MLKKVPVLENLDELLLLMICNSLKPVSYDKCSYIVREGDPIDTTFFITQGIAWSYTTNNNGEGTSSSHVECLEKGHFFGEELLSGLNVASPPFNPFRLPVSSKIVKSHTKVEALALMANDLKNIVEQLENDAAISPILHSLFSSSRIALSSSHGRTSHGQPPSSAASFLSPHSYLLFLILGSLTSISMVQLFRPSLPPISSYLEVDCADFRASKLGVFEIHGVVSASEHRWARIDVMSNRVHRRENGGRNQDIEGQYLRTNGFEVEGQHSNNDGADSAERRMPRTILDPRRQFLQVPCVGQKVEDHSFCFADGH
uniref:Cyclic nucleotide-binding domain-containing protein n=1 Tax=Fagus sylvatica TaxID=28930 RepID=A0A2N9FIK2_FAGSY